MAYTGPWFGVFSYPEAVDAVARLTTVGILFFSMLLMLANRQSGEDITYSSSDLETEVNGDLVGTSDLPASVEESLATAQGNIRNIKNTPPGLVPN